MLPNILFALALTSMVISLVLRAAHFCVIWYEEEIADAVESIFPYDGMHLAPLPVVSFVLFIAAAVAKYVLG